MKSRLVKVLLVVAFAVVIMLLLISSCGKDRGQDEPSPAAPSPTPTAQSTSAPAPSIDNSPAPDVVEPSATPQDSPKPSDPVSPAPTENTSAPTPTGPISTPAQPTPPLPTASTPTASPDDPDTQHSAGGTVPFSDWVDDDWFSDAAFLGNSLVDGFRLFSGLTTCDVYAATSMTVMGAGNLISQMNAKQYGKVYILLGINEIGFDPDYFKTQYASMLDTIIAGQPDADIYIMGLTPVSEHKSNTDSTFTMDRVRAYNDRLLSLAIEKGCYYIDLCEALSDENGYLPASVTTDGVHFSASHYQVWLEYLRTHHA